MNVGIAEAALRTMMARQERQGPYEAEIAPGCDPLWHLLRVTSGQEKVAASHLSARRFGCYLPMVQRVSVVRGKSVTYSSPMFGSYLFVFVWDVMRHWRRIRACPGVVGIEMNNQQPIVVADDIIDHIQAREFEKSASWNADMAVSSETKRRPRRRRREAGHVSAESSDAGATLKISTRSFWNDVEALDAEARISTLRQSLGLAS